jgi:integrase
MAKVAFSDAKLRSIAPPEKGQLAVWDASLPGFGLRVSQGGSKTFVLNRNNTLLTIGRFGVLSLSEARTEAKRLMAEFTLGKVRPQSITFNAAKELFLTEKKKTRRARTHQNQKQRLDLHFKFSGQLVDFTHTELVRKLGKIKSNSEHDHALSVAKTFFTWAQNRRYIDDNPCRGLSPHGHTSRTRVLSDEELGKIWRACEQRWVLADEEKSSVKYHPLPASYCTIIRLLILTGQRKSEIAGLRNGYISNDICTLPPTLTKNGRQHSFPLGSLTATILQTVTSTSLSDHLLFPAKGASATGVRSFNGWSKSKAALDKASGVTGWTVHDIRRTYRTVHARIGTPPHIAERLVNHVSSRSPMEEIYDRHTYLDEMRKAVDSYEGYLLKLLVG